MKSPTDNPIDESNCYPVSNSLCNLRSAWHACDRVSVNSICTINFIESFTVTLNSSLEPLFLNRSIIVNGRGAILQGDGSNGLIRREIDSSEAPSLTLNDIIIQSFRQAVYLPKIKDLKISNVTFQNIIYGALTVGFAKTDTPPITAYHQFSIVQSSFVNTIGQNDINLAEAFVSNTIHSICYIKVKRRLRTV